MWEGTCSYLNMRKYILCYPNNAFLYYLWPKGHISYKHFHSTHNWKNNISISTSRASWVHCRCFAGFLISKKESSWSHIKGTNFKWLSFHNYESD